MESMESEDGKLRIYGLTQNTKTNEYMMVFDGFHSLRYQGFGCCIRCKQYNTLEAWCQACDPQIATQGWTSGNMDIDNCIREFQLNTEVYESMIEWIPFDRLSNMQISEGSESVFTSTWLDGIRTLEGSEYRGFKKSRTPFCKVSLKTLHYSQASILDIIQEFKDHMRLIDDVYYIYGLTKNTATNEYMMVFNEIRLIKDSSSYEKCAHCDQYYTNLELWCQACEVQGWTSGNMDIDDCIKEYQLTAARYDMIIEWIPFDRLKNIYKIGEGGFGSVFSAIWLDGIRKNQGSRKHSCTVALKTLPGIQTDPSYFLKEFRNHMKCRLVNSITAGSQLEIYGLTQNTISKEYLVVLQYANRGSLHKFLSKSKDLTWKLRLKLLEDISNDLAQIHKAGFIHCDLHSGNILINQYINRSFKCYIADLGLSRKKNESVLEKEICGIMPYIAPEILLGQQYTFAADIYSLGIIMTEMSTRKRPFIDYPHNLNLALRICNGSRPKFAPETPDCYVQLAMQCMSSDVQKRPTAEVVNSTIRDWNLDDLCNSNIEDLNIAADKIKTSHIFKQNYLNSQYISKPINTQEIEQSYKVFSIGFDDFL
ncbi:kinase-like domain-containing protein [Gigaspora rosea]|uniref:Kinase-like domain-containing protein n=1 Tax=Gigaspora rosea TaxID=44941 RepID=A0A397U383_9GLOM|nr:kinase-like domain-containing protein [Gigaspora rosea]